MINNLNSNQKYVNGRSVSNSTPYKITLRSLRRNPTLNKVARLGFICAKTRCAFCSKVLFKTTADPLLKKLNQRDPNKTLKLTKKGL